MSCHLVDPLCILRGYDQFRSWEYRSTVYFQWLYLFINTIMDPQCILWRPYLASLDHPSIGMPALGLKHVIIFVGCLCAASVRFSASIPLLESLQSISVISSLSSNFILWGAICYTSKLLTLIVSQVSSLQVSQVSHFAHKCRKCQESILP
jgi:hypothetical protein